MPALKAIARYAPREAYYVQTGAAGTAPAAHIFVAPDLNSYEVVEVYACFSTVGGAAAAADVKIVPSGTDIAAGTTVLAAAIDLTTGADASKKAALHATNRKVLNPRETLAVTTAGTLTGLAGLVIHVVLKPLTQPALR